MDSQTEPSEPKVDYSTILQHAAFVLSTVAMSITVWMLIDNIFYSQKQNVIRRSQMEILEQNLETLKQNQRELEQIQNELFRK